jgi:L-malate glycosyltransferase
VVGMAANFRPHKNQLQLIEAAKIVVTENRNIFFLLAGQPSYYQDIVAERIRDLNLESHVHIVGAMNGTSEFNANIDLGVLCSVTEGLSNSILEYMAHGKPVITTNVDGNAELVTDQEHGLLVELDNAEELAQAILTLSRDPEKCKEMGARNRARARAQFNWKDGLEKWDNLYQSLL